MSYRLTNGERRNQWGGNMLGTANRKNNGERDRKPRPSHKAQTRRKANGERLRDGDYEPPVLANPGNIINCGAGGGGNMGNDICHENEAPFPELLAEWFIRSYCRPGGTVLDPFSGSGTTASVAKRLGRNAIAIDIRESQVELTKRRIASVQMELIP